MMADEQSPGTEPQPEKRKESGNGKQVAVTIIAIGAVIVGATLFLNRDRLPVHSDVLQPSAPSSTGPGPTNQPPVIDALAVESDRIEPFSLCVIECDASDPDGDPLTYAWTVSSGEIFGEGPRVEWGSPINEGLYRISVTVDDGNGGIAEYSSSLHVKKNSPPVFSGMTADSDWVLADGSARIECQVSDADGDTIDLEWRATAGRIVGTGNAIIWTAPQDDGVYWITVYADDSYGGEARRAIPISVSSGEPPKIDGLFLQGVNTNMLRKVGNDWMIYQGRTASITCAVLGESDAYSWEWTADFGQITFDGPVATWVAPPSRVGATVTVTVTDEYGRQSSANVFVNVETCTCSF